MGVTGFSAVIPTSLNNKVVAPLSAVDRDTRPRLPHPNKLDSAHESLVETSRQESIRSSLLSGVLGAAHGRPEAVRNHVAGTRTFDQGAIEVAG